MLAINTAIQSLAGLIDHRLLQIDLIVQLLSDPRLVGKRGWVEFSLARTDEK